MKQIIGYACAALLCCAGCSQTPKTIEAPQLRVAVSPADADSRVITLEGGVYNESGSVVIVDYSAQAIIKGKDGRTILTVPVKAEKVFPFMAVRLAGDVTVDMQRFAKLASEFSLSDPSAAKKASAEDEAFLIPEEQVRLEKVSCRKQPIDKLLKEGSK